MRACIHACMRVCASVIKNCTTNVSVESGSVLASHTSHQNVPTKHSDLDKNYTQFAEDHREFAEAIECLLRLQILQKPYSVCGDHGEFVEIKESLQSPLRVYQDKKSLLRQEFIETT